VIPSKTLGESRMKIEISNFKPMIDAIEFAINQIYHDMDTGTLHAGTIAAKTICELQMIQVTFMLADRHATKEQRKDSARQDCTCCAGDKAQWFTPSNCQLHSN
jgi:hypothetical protein